MKSSLKILLLATAMLHGSAVIASDLVGRELSPNPAHNSSASNGQLTLHENAPQQGESFMVLFSQYSQGDLAELLTRSVAIRQQLNDNSVLITRRESEIANTSKVLPAAHKAANIFVNAQQENLEARLEYKDKMDAAVTQLNPVSQSIVRMVLALREGAQLFATDTEQVRKLSAQLGTEELEAVKKLLGDTGGTLAQLLEKPADFFENELSVSPGRARTSASASPSSQQHQQQDSDDGELGSAAFE